MAFVVVRSPEEWHERFGADASGSVVTVGNFDGVHLGHQKILRSVVALARDKTAKATVVTFDPHPLCVLRPEQAPSLLMTLPQRIKAIERLSVDAVFVLRFDRALSLLGPEEFVTRVLVQTLKTKGILVGANFRFGHRGQGTVRDLEIFGREYGFEVRTIEPVQFRGRVISSTEIRNAIREGAVSRAGRLLGRPFELAGQIRTGTGLGRKLIVPTLNLHTEQTLIPKNGVYITQTRLGERLFDSATNIGIRPTFDGQRTTIETHVFDFSEELTSGVMELLFWRRLRDEKKFSGPEALRQQVLVDLERARQFFSRLDCFRRTTPPNKPDEEGFFSWAQERPTSE